MESPENSFPRAGPVLSGHATIADDTADGTECRHPENLSGTSINATEEPVLGLEDGETRPVLLEPTLLSASKFTVTRAMDDKIEGAAEGERGLHAMSGLNKGEINDVSRKGISVNEALPLVPISAEKSDAGVLLLLVGVPGSGKSTFCSKLMANASQPWTRICQDIISKGKTGTKKQCLQHAERALAQKLSVVIDRCNIDRAQRLEFLQLSASLGIAAHAVVLDVPMSVCIQRAAKRREHEGGLNAGNAGSVINRFKSTRQLPALSEGFSRITFCRTDTDVENAVQQYRDLTPTKRLESGVFGAVQRKNENALESFFGKGSNQTHWSKTINSKDPQVEKAREEPHQAQPVGREENQQMEEGRSSFRSDAADIRDLASGLCMEDKGPCTLAFPSISTSDFQFDREKASTVLVEAVAKFLSAEDSKMRLVLVDLTTSHMLTLVRGKAREKGLDPNRFLTYVGDITKLRSSHGPACNVIANAANWRLKAGGGGVNAAIYSAAGPDLERATRAVAQTLSPGNSVAVRLPESSPLHSHQGVTHVIHVLGPNMNPKRPNCLSGDYTEGCRVLESSYTGLFQKFSSVVRSGLVAKVWSNAESRKNVEASSTKEISSKEDASKVSGGIQSTHQQPSQNAFTVLMQASKRNMVVKDANPKGNKVRVTEEVAAGVGRGSENTAHPQKVDASQFYGLKSVNNLQDEPHSDPPAPSAGRSPRAVSRSDETDQKKQEGLTGATGNQQGGSSNVKKWDRWTLALHKTAMRPEQHKDALLQITDDAVVLHDKYPKAKRHILVVARRPGLDGLENARKEHLLVLRNMHSLGEEWAANSLKEDPSLSFRIGYHLVPSMRQLHLHVISQDFDSAALKTKKHWNSFTTPFFRDSLDVLDQLDGHGQVQGCDKSSESLLELELRCHRCRSAHPNLVRLKQHISTCRQPLANTSFLITVESLAVGIDVG